MLQPVQCLDSNRNNLLILKEYFYQLQTSLLTVILFQHFEAVIPQFPFISVFIEKSSVSVTVAPVKVICFLHWLMKWSFFLLFQTFTVISGCCGLSGFMRLFVSMKSESEGRSVVSNFLWPHGLHCPWNSPGQNAGVGRLSLLQGIFPTQGLNPGLPHRRQILYQLSHKESPRIREWIAYPFSSRSSWPRNRTRVFCIAGGFFTNWAMREAFVSIAWYLS